jgi:putative photosynthetic complex assembly protein
MTEVRHDKSPPRAALVAIVALLSVTVLLITTARLSAGGETQPVAPDRGTAAIKAEAALRFEDRADGAVVVRAAETGAIVTVLQPGTHGFVRGVMRGLARDRRMRGLTSGPPFLLTRWQDGRLTIRDTATGRTIDLLAFGSAQTASFATILDAARATSV